MRCEEIHELFADLIYDEAGTLQANHAVQEHLRTCQACRQELEELDRTRKLLQAWKDEPPLRSVTIPGQNRLKESGWKYLRYAAAAAMTVICFLALANAEIKWNNEGFVFRTSLFSRGKEQQQDYYTRAEVRELIKHALDDSELRMNEVNYLMMQKMLDTVEQERWMDLRYVRAHGIPAGNTN